MQTEAQLICAVTIDDMVVAHGQTRLLNLTRCALKAQEQTDPHVLCCDINISGLKVEFHIGCAMVEVDE